MKETQHAFLVLIASFLGLLKECNHLLHHLGGLIIVILDAYCYGHDHIISRGKIVL